MKKYWMFAAHWCVVITLPLAMTGQTQVSAETTRTPYFSIAAGLLQSFPGAANSSYQGSIYQLYTSPSTTTSLYIERKAEYLVKHQLKGQWGAFVEGHIHFPIGSEWALKTGIGVQYEQFSYETTRELKEIGDVIDSVEINTVDNSNYVYQTVLEPSYNPDASQALEYDLLQLRLPVLLQYQTPLGVQVEAGLFLQSLLWSATSRYETDLRSERETLPDGKILYTTYVGTAEKKYTPALGMASATAGWQVGFSYRLNRLGLTAAYSQSIINGFVNQEADEILNSNFQNYNAKLIYRYARIGIYYFL